MSNKWAGRALPSLDHILNLFDNPTMSAFITGHLIIESILVQLIDLKEERENTFKKNFPTKIKMCIDLKLITPVMGEYLKKVNQLRNKLAHNLGYRLSFEEVFSLCKEASEAGIDFSDDTIHSDKETSEEWYGTEGIIQELFQNTAIDLGFVMEEHGGEFQFA